MKLFKKYVWWKWMIVTFLVTIPIIVLLVIPSIGIALTLAVCEFAKDQSICIAEKFDKHIGHRLRQWAAKK